VRGKKAKMLRRLARQMTVGMPTAQYQDKALNPRKPTKRTRFLYECTKLVNKNLKRAYKTRGKLL